jgi:soluble lytic murein transglycosylase-like protein
LDIFSCLSRKELERADKFELAKEISRKASKYNLDKRIVAALVYQESNGNIWAFRWEKGFYKKYIEGKGRSELSGHVPASFPTLETEMISRAISWGAFQIMGETLRWQGFKEDYMPMACLPRINAEIGCKYLRWCLDRISADTDTTIRYQAALLKYNGGGDPMYPTRVFRHIENENYLKILNPSNP